MNNCLMKGLHPENGMMEILLHGEKKGQSLKKYDLPMKQ